MPGLDNSTWTDIHRFAFQMFYSRYFDRKEKAVYLAGQLPFKILQNFQRVLDGNAKKVRVQLRTCMYACMHACMRVCLCLCMYVFVDVCLCVDVCVSLSTHF
jgi:hypothetical protein